ncbi:hypothetical protein BDV93DRAFT_555470 [Ceratobasidium sp. AG-I]|nr:hypothetical protein BDV93DRAFT_555470 [Ceratobasidium sp. AG-I]
MIIHIVLFKLKAHPSLEGATPPATFTDATATNVIEATHGEINAHQEKIKSDITAALKKVPGWSKHVPMISSLRLTLYCLNNILILLGSTPYYLPTSYAGPLTMELGPPLLPERAKGFDFGLYSRFKDKAALEAYAVSKEHMDAVINIIRPNADVMFKLKTQPSLVESTQPGTFTDATATSAIQATQDEINVYQEKVMEEIAAALKQVPGPLTPMHLGPPLLSERAKGWNFGIYARFKDRAALRAYDVSEAHQRSADPSHATNSPTY